MDAWRQAPSATDHIAPIGDRFCNLQGRRTEIQD
jgi:hypothetical protein